LFRKYAKPLFKGRIRVLEIGPDGYPSTYRKIIGGDDIEWETADIFHGDKITYLVKDGCTFPIPDNTFDIVLSGQVIEHVKKPWIWMKEAARICKKGGKVITIAPVSWTYHEQPVDCWRIYPEGMRALYENSGLEIDLCLFETLEKVRSRRMIPGCSSEPVTFRNKATLLCKKFLGWPVTRSFDTIAIGTKR
jgi:SAM-dependent methyltransferase